MHTAATLPRSVDPLGAHDVEHREDFRRFVVEDAEPWHREQLGRLYQLWAQGNAAYFDGALVPPYILLTEPAGPRTYVDCGAVSGFGGRSQNRIRPSLLAGTHPHLRGQLDGRLRFVADVLLHETIHQWQQERSGQTEQAWHGHGPAFRDRANAIGRALGLAPVRTAKRRGSDRHLPSCAQWPHCVRPPDYYLGAYRPPLADPGDDHAEEHGPDAGAASGCATTLTPDEWRRVHSLVARRVSDGLGSDDAVEHQCWRRLLDRFEERAR
ncbi:MAG: hypothetical protein HY744_12710 [Deltaproteobacteria bacterium]|nr:hypothetical protein [Deltaproteobacteria bacterium]